MEGAMVITDRMKYGVKPCAVRSANNLHSIKASNGPSFDVAMGEGTVKRSTFHMAMFKFNMQLVGLGKSDLCEKCVLKTLNSS